jgi:hypothetical protein
MTMLLVSEIITTCSGEYLDDMNNLTVSHKNRNCASFTVTENQTKHDKLTASGQYGCGDNISVYSGPMSRPGLSHSDKGVSVRLCFHPPGDTVIIVQPIPVAVPIAVTSPVAESISLGPANCLDPANSLDPANPVVDNLTRPVAAENPGETLPESK